MKHYRYRARDALGNQITGDIRAESREEAAREIRSRYPVLIRLKEESRTKKLLSRELGRPKGENKELALLCERMSLILGSGMSADKCMELASRQTRDKRLKNLLALSAGEISRGSTVAGSFQRLDPALPTVFLESIRAGEEAGSLEKTFAMLGTYYENRYQMQQKLRQAMAYPVFVLTVALVVLGVIMLYVVPSMTQAYTQLGGTLPLITRMLIGIAGFLKHYLWAAGVLGILTLWAVRLLVKQKNGRLAWDSFRLRLPVWGNLQRLDAGMQISRTMEMLLSAGISLGKALEITGKVLDNRALGETVSRMEEQILGGKSLGAALGETEQMPDTLREMCAMGEETGELEHALRLAGSFYENELKEASQRAIRRLEPTVLLLMALFAGFLVLAVYLPMFGMYELL